ncbi:MAG: YggS family pyridoxal phosphate-dependent enzyme [archaeon]|jgi:hypothetical protein
MFDKEKYLKIASEVNSGVKILAATKTKPKEEVLAALNAKISLFGENYVLEAEEKYSFILPKLHSFGAKLHLIGHLQGNKAKKAVELFDCIETIDSEKLANKVNSAAVMQNKIMDVMIEVNFEEQKSGVRPEKVEALAQTVRKLNNLNLVGLMCVPKIGEEKENFKLMQELKQKLGVPQLSMGMSSDYKIAIQYGATIVRLGTILFGEREKKN